MRLKVPWQAVRFTVLAVGFSALVVVLLLYLAGRFSPKVSADGRATPAPRPVAGPVATARLLELPSVETAVGTVRAVHETSVGSKITARVVAVDLKAGQPVKQGDVLVQLDDKDLRARLQQAQAALASAKALHANAVSDEARLRQALTAGAVSRQEYDKAQTLVKATAAEVERSTEAANEAQAVLEYATVRAPMDGTVIDKKVDRGDTVVPGQVLLTLYDPKHMQLVASVRESLAQHLKVGQQIGVRIDVLPVGCAGTVSEIVPESQASSRSFQVKVTGPCPPGIYSGMFGRLMIPTGTERVLVVPAATVRKVGQVELVDVVVRGHAERRAVRTGRALGRDVEILSGLAVGEQVVADVAQATAPAAEGA